MHIRPLTTLEDCRRVVELEKRVWGYTDAEDVVPAPILIVTVKRGGILLGAFDDAGQMKGFVYSLPAVKDGRITQWSHMLGVADEARDRGLGRRLKLAQREEALRQGIDLIEWTFDPLQAMNAHFNFTKLGIVAAEYEENIYGESSSALHRGTPTDRLIAEWNIGSAHVERRVGGAGPLLRDAGVASATVINPSRQAGKWLEPGIAPVEIEDQRRVLVEIPTGFTEMQAHNPALALEWRMASRMIFQTWFSHGYRAVDFFLSRDAGRGHYLLTRD